jgi:HD-GYP domain-containing protein (c-di-GMP phosphodiesterase class II)
MAQSVAPSSSDGQRKHAPRTKLGVAASRLAVSHLRREVSRLDREFQQLSRVCTALMAERNLTGLLHLIVEQGKQLTESDGAGLLFLETHDNRAPSLVPVAYHFDSLPNLGLPLIRYPADGSSIVGYAALTKAPVVVDDMHQLPRGTRFTGSAEFQRRYRYHARSLLAVPMIDHNDVVLGVLFFVNRKSPRGANVRSKADADRYVLPYTDRELRLAGALASMAAVSIENTRLQQQIEGLLESMVKAAVSAIDERDPATAGHSIRVAALTTALAEAVTSADDGPYQNVHFTTKELRELHFAALLHDLGKVVVREEVLLKRTKLPPKLWERVNARFDLIRRSMQLEYAKQYGALCRTSPDDAAAIQRLDAELAAELEELKCFHSIVRAANEPAGSDAVTPGALVEIASRTFMTLDGTMAPYLTEEELRYLQIRSGTLDHGERREIESHVEHTRRFLSQIPWTRDLKNLVRYACGHHEKLNGTGYPRGLRADDIPIQTRMITVADIFDALTESDRPYRPAFSPDQALKLMRADADAGLLDRELVEIMARSRVYRRVIGMRRAPIDGSFGNA